jgi:hypothetical protein
MQMQRSGKADNRQQIIVLNQSGSLHCVFGFGTSAAVARTTAQSSQTVLATAQTTSVDCTQANPAHTQCREQHTLTASSSLFATV